jgi:hypothetical protein
MPTTPSEKDPRTALTAWGEFSNAETEERYRCSIHAEQTWIALLLVTAGLARALVLIPSDRQLLGNSPAFWDLMWGRAFLVALSLGLLVALRWNLRPSLGALKIRASVMERFLFLWCVLGTLAQFAAGFARGPSFFLAYAYMALVIVLLWYFVVPLRFRFQLALAFLTTAASLYLLSRNSELDSLTRRSLLASIVLVNLVAATSAWFFHRLKRRAFAALCREEELRIGLESALAEVKTLRGILPICAHCKRIRDDVGSWQQMEVYVREHTDAEFSHGICPECVQTHYPKYAESQRRRQAD